MTEHAPGDKPVVKRHQPGGERLIKGTFRETDLKAVAQREVTFGNVEKRALLGLERSIVVLEVIEKDGFDMVDVEHILKSSGIREPVVQKVSAQLTLNDLFVELNGAQ